MMKTQNKFGLSFLQMSGVLVASIVAMTLMTASASADVELSGDAKLGFEYNSNPDANQKKYGFVHDFDVKFNASGDTDRGLSFGASMELGHDGAVSGSKAWIGSDFGTVSFGAVDAGDDYVALSKVGLDGLGVADIVKVNGGSASQFRYDYSQGAFSVALSAGKSTGATMWTVTNHRGFAHVFTEKPSEYQYTSQFDGLVVARGEQGEITVSREPVGQQGDQKAITQITVANVAKHYVRDGKLFNGMDEEVTPSVTADADQATYDREMAAIKNQIAAVNAYKQAYDLGPDMKVGGGDDTRKGQADNSSHGEDADTIHYAIGTSLQFGSATVSAGYDSRKTMSVGAGYDFGQGNVNGVYVKAEDGNGYGVDGTFNVNDATSITVNYAKLGMKTGYGLGAKHDLGGGAEFVGGVAKVGDSIKASVGMNFAF